MTASSFGPKNAPQFADTDAPDVALNPTQVAIYAAKVGNRRIGTAAERTAATGLDVWEGLEWYDTTDGNHYLYNAGAWVYLDGGTNTLVDVSTFGTGWTATNTTNHKPRLRMVGKQAFLYGAVTISGGASATSILTVPVGFQPPNASARYVGLNVSSGLSIGELALTAGVLGFATGYVSNPVRTTGDIFPLHCSWWMD